MASSSTSTPRVAIVTGASHGIGAAVAERLAKDGLAVVINYSRGSDVAQALVAKIKQAGGVATAVQADVSDPAAVAGHINTPFLCLIGRSFCPLLRPMLSLPPPGGLDKKCRKTNTD